LDVLPEIINYHAMKSGRSPLCVVDNKLVALCDDEDTDAADFDKFIVYSAFPSSNEQLLKVSRTKRVSP
jgi:hypothetical protein